MGESKHVSESYFSDSDPCDYGKSPPRRLQLLDIWASGPLLTAHSEIWPGNRALTNVRYLIIEVGSPSIGVPRHLPRSRAPLLSNIPYATYYFAAVSRGCQMDVRLAFSCASVQLDQLRSS
jgi:hypothetical protein